MTHLDLILDRTRRLVEQRKRDLPVDRLRDAVAAERSARPFAEALSGPGLSIIAEHKRRSPSAGIIRADLDLATIVAGYEDGGASALSVLTESEGFGGSLDDLVEARKASILPVLRKDFIIDRYQLAESAAAGADALLLIVAAMDASLLDEMHSEALELGLDVLVEIHDEDELQTAIDVGAQVIGINNRDLRDFTVDPGRTLELIRDVPTGKTVVAESGITGRPLIEEFEASGVDAALVGETLMRAPDPARAVAQLLGRT